MSCGASRTAGADGLRTSVTPRSALGAYMNRPRIVAKLERINISFPFISFPCYPLNRRSDWLLASLINSLILGVGY
jgi:hypothetical protein